MPRPVSEKVRLLSLMSGYAEFLLQTRELESLTKVCKTGSRLSALSLQESSEEDDKLFLMSESLRLYVAGYLLILSLEVVIKALIRPSGLVISIHGVFIINMLNSENIT